MTAGVDVVGGGSQRHPPSPRPLPPGAQHWRGACQTTARDPLFPGPLEGSPPRNTLCDVSPTPRVALLYQAPCLVWLQR